MLLRHIGRRNCAMARLLAAVSMEIHPCCSTTPTLPWAYEDQHVGTRRQPAARLPIAKPFIGAPMLHQKACAAIQQYHERKLFGYTPQQMYEVVANVEQYKEFVPWCVRSTVLREGSDSIDAELEIGFQLFVERYTSRVTVRQPHLIKAVAEDSTLFDRLENLWEFKPGPTSTSCWVSFTVDFAFKSELYAQVATVFFEQVVQKTISAFEDRCEQLYGPSSLKRKRP